MKKKKNRRVSEPVKVPSGMMVKMEQSMRDLQSRGDKTDPRNRAQDLAYEAMESPDPVRGLQLAAKALTVDPHCVDAHLIMIEVLDKEEDRIYALRKVVQWAEADFGEDFFKENRGHFWGILETRPYMRARKQLADLLMESDRISEAIREYEDLLELNENDNQGNRYFLLGLYLSTDRLDGAQRLFDSYSDEGSAAFVWSFVLSRYLSNDLAGAADALQRARQVNKYVEGYLTGKKRMPAHLPEYYGIGDVSEAIVCNFEIGKAWRKHPAAVQWLAAAEPLDESKRNRGDSV